MSRGLIAAAMALGAVVRLAPQPIAQAEDMQLGPSQVALPYSFRDNFGNPWDVQLDGSIGPGTVNIYDAGGKLFVGQNEQYAPNVQAAQFDAAHNELTFAQQPMAGLKVSRQVSVDAAAGWCRWIEVLENPGGAAIKTQVHVNFALNAAVQASQEITDSATHKTIGLAVFDGTRAFAMVGGGRGATVSPTYAPQQGNDQVDVSWEVEVPPHRSAAVLHLQAIRPTANEAQSFIQKTTARQILRDLTPALARSIVNFAAHSGAFGDLELLRGDLLDVIELRGGDQYKGTFQEKTLAVQTPYGLVTLPTERVLAMLAVGDFRPTQMLVTRDGEAFGGVLQSPLIHVQLSSGQVTAVPIASVRRMGLRHQPTDVDEFRYEHPMLLLRNGDRIAVDMPAESIPVSTRYGNLLLKPQSIGALLFQVDDQPVHQLLMTDGSRIAALVSEDALELRPLSTGADKPMMFPTAAISRLQLAKKIDEPGDTAAIMALSTGDRLVGALAGKLSLETAYDTIEINGGEVRELRHAGSAPTEVQIALWDDTSLSGRMKGDVIDMTLNCGPALRVPTALVEEYKQPQAMPPQWMMERLRGLVTDLAGEDWKRADRARSELVALGPKVSGALLAIRGRQNKTAQERIDGVIASIGERPQGPVSTTQNAAPITKP